MPIRPVRLHRCAGWTAAVCPHSRPLSVAGFPPTREVSANVRCGIGSSGRCLSVADYVTMRGPSDWAPAAEGARVAYAPCSSTVARHPRYRIFRIMSLGLAFSVTVHGGR